jgi:hypothetical protein
MTGMTGLFSWGIPGASPDGVYDAPRYEPELCHPARAERKRGATGDARRRAAHDRATVPSDVRRGT